LGKKTARKLARTDGRVHTLFPDGDGRLPPGEPAHGQRYVRRVRAKSDNQERLLDALAESSVVLALGPAGTGKTFLAVARAVEALEEGAVQRLILCRPAVEAGETLGFLPGDLEAKLAPYLRPIYDALSDRLGGRRLKQLLSDDTIEIAPVAFMRGRTLSNAFILVDEAQNCTYGQLKLLLTRLGPGSTLVIAGDPEQSDLLPGMSGLSEVAHRLEPLGGVAIIRLTAEDVVRHPLVAEMLSVL